MLVFEYKVVDYQYFMDEMQEYEINNIVENIKYADKNEWESARLIAYVIAKANFKNIKKAQDFLPLPWDDTTSTPTKKKAKNTNITQEEIDRLKKLSEKWT